MNQKWTDIPTHLELYLGPIVKGWNDARSTHKIKVVKFNNTPEKMTSTYATIGLSDFPFFNINKNEIRQELIFSTYEKEDDNSIVSLLFSLAEAAIEKGRPYRRGEVAPIRWPIVVGSTVSAVYATNPSPFSDELDSLDRASPPVIFVFFVPITDLELKIVKNYGWEIFEELLESFDPDVWDLRRLDEISYPS